MVDIKITPKTVTIRPLEEQPFGLSGCIDELWEEGKIVIREYSGHKVCRHLLKDWGDGTFTLYPQREGEPFLLKPEGGA